MPGAGGELGAVGRRGGRSCCRGQKFKGRSKRDGHLRLKGEDMKKQITSALLGFAMLFAIVASASAQTAHRITIQIPFDFIAGRTELPAGKYTVRRIQSESESVLMFVSEDGRNAAAVITNSSTDAPTRAQVVFRQRGDRYFLAAVSLPGTSSVRIAPESKAEKKFARELIARRQAGDDASKSVTVAGSIR
jgi:hypothetical protein